MVVGVAQGNVVEDVVRIHAELQPEAFGKLEVLHDGSIRREVAVAVQRVKAGIADVSGAGIKPCAPWRDWGEVLDVGSAAHGMHEAAGPEIEGPNSLVRPADP